MLIFERVRYKNFLSAGNRFIEIKLNESKTTLITGQNGSGKSAGIIDAVYFALYGKAYRKLKKEQIVNTINKKECLVELEFSIGENSYMIRRGISPNIFEVYVNGVLKEQDASIKDYQDWLVDNILKMNSTTMKQIVFLGSTSFVPFMRLSTGDRRKVIEEILDIQVFSLMNKILKSRANTLSGTYSDIQHNIKMLETKIDMAKKHIDEIVTQKEKQIESNKKQLESIDKEIKTLEKEISASLEEVKKLLSSISDYTKVKSDFSELDKILSTFNSNKRKHERELKFFSDNDECPTCGQEIEIEFKKSQISDRERKLSRCVDGIDAAKVKLQEFEDRLNEIYDIQEAVNRLEMEINARQSRISTMLEHSESIRVANEKLANETHDESEKDSLSELEQFRQELKMEKLKRQDIAKQGHYYTIISSLLKDDGIKSMIIQNYLPTINSLIRKYLEILEFNCEFTFDEKFEETLKSRYRDNFSYANFSEGQKMRIDLALLFSWRELARLRNSASCNLLVLDEIGSSSLDAEGTSAFMRIINETADNSNVFVISHDSSIIDQFSSSIEYKLQDNFSVIS